MQWRFWRRSPARVPDPPPEKDPKREKNQRERQHAILAILGLTELNSARTIEILNKERDVMTRRS